MLRVNIVCVGKIKELFYREAVAEYVKRLGRFCECKIIEVAECTYSSESERVLEHILEIEGEALLKAMRGYVVVLAIEGSKLSSEALSQLIFDKKNAGVSEMTFVIGGSYGISDSVKAKADFKLSFSDMTFPHMLMRVILAEQLYRSFMIGTNSGYHK